MDFTRYSGHTSVPAAGTGRRWTRDDMLEEIYAQKRREIEKLRKDRTRLSKELANRHTRRQYAVSREELLAFLQSPQCGLFNGARKVIAVKDRELDRLIEVGGEEVVDWTSVAGMEDSSASRDKMFMVLVQRINEGGMRFDSFKALVVMMKMVRVEMVEAAAAQAAAPLAAAEEPIPVEAEYEAEYEPDQPEQEQPAAEAEKSVEQPTEEPAAQQPTTEEPQATQQVDEPEPEYEPEAVDVEPAATPSPTTQPETTEPETEPEQAAVEPVEPPFVLPEDGRNRNHSISHNNNVQLTKPATADDDSTTEDSKQQHARHNTMAEGEQAAAAEGEKLSVGSLMEKLAELEEEQDEGWDGAEHSEL